jgi:peroxiredoxin
MNRLIIILTVLNLLIWTSGSHAVDTGDSAPDFQVVTLDGKEISYYKDVKGKRPLYLIFWSSW